MAKNSSLTDAKRNIEDEFYTQLSDIEKELKHYTDHFRGKTVFCNCDDPEESNFWKYFELNFERLGLKRLISTHYETDKPSYKLEIVGDINKDGTVNNKDIIKTKLSQNGDFRSPEAIDLLKQADIVCTNPPFSLFREFVSQLMEYEKSFIIIGNQNSCTYKEFFPLLKDGKVWQGYGCGDMKFTVPDYYEPRETRFWIDENGQKWRSLGNICWYTNLDIKKRHEDIILYKKYSADEYPEFDNYHAINVDKVADIPSDYFDPMGVPVTFLDKHSQEQFEILDANDYRKTSSIPIKKHGLIKDKDGSINGKPKYARILIRRKSQ